MRQKLLILSVVVLLACTFVFGFAFMGGFSSHLAPGHTSGRPQLAPISEGNQPPI